MKFRGKNTNTYMQTKTIEAEQKINFVGPVLLHFQNIRATQMDDELPVCLCPHIHFSVYIAVSRFTTHSSHNLTALNWYRTVWPSLGPRFNSNHLAQYDKQQTYTIIVVALSESALTPRSRLWWEQNSIQSGTRAKGVFSTQIQPQGFSQQVDVCEIK